MPRNLQRITRRTNCDSGCYQRNWARKTHKKTADGGIKKTTNKHEVIETGPSFRGGDYASRRRRWKRSHRQSLAALQKIERRPSMASASRPPVDGRRSNDRLFVSVRTASLLPEAFCSANRGMDSIFRTRVAMMTFDYSIGSKVWLSRSLASIIICTPILVFIAAPTWFLIVWLRQMDCLPLLLDRFRCVCRLCVCVCGPSWSVFGTFSTFPPVLHRIDRIGTISIQIVDHLPVLFVSYLVLPCLPMVRSSTYSNYPVVLSSCSI